MILAGFWWLVWLMTAVALRIEGAPERDQHGYAVKATAEQAAASRIGLGMLVANPLALAVALAVANTH